MSSRLRRAFTSEKKPAAPETPVKSTLTPAQQANASYWDAVEDEHAPGGGGGAGGAGGGDSTVKGKGREIERLWGLENFGNTCYCNSVLQALYACEPFKQFVESYPSIPPPVAPLGPPAGSELFKALPPEKQVSVNNFPLGSGLGPASPIASKSNSNPFDNPTSGGAAGGKPATPGSVKEKRGWGGLGRRQSTSQGTNGSSGGGGGAGPTSPSLETPPTTLTSAPAPNAAAKLDIPIVVPNPDQPPPTVFETIQTLFHHLTTSAPHQPIATKKPQDSNSQTASLLPVDGGPSPSLTTSSNPNQPQGPPLLASLPPPSAPRGGGPYAAGSLGRGVVRPEDLLKTVKKENEMFRGMSQQDAHEFLGWLLNRVAEEIELLDKGLRANGKEVTEVKGFGKTFVQNLFEGVLTNETRCLSCETTSSRDELFLDLSIDIEQHTSVTSCLRQFSASEMLCQKNKFFCDSCCGLQEAEKRMKIKRLPNVLALHLKRFKYQENLGRYTKLFYRVPFPTQLKLPNTSDDVEDPDRLYELFAVVVHIGNGPHHGHYVAMVKSAGRWIMCDDENIEPVDEKDIYRYFGDYPSGAGYVLFYQAVDLDLKDLGMKNPPTKPATPVAEPMRTVPTSVVVEEQPAPATVNGNGAPNLMDVQEQEEHEASGTPGAAERDPSVGTAPPVIKVATDTIPVQTQPGTGTADTPITPGSATATASPFTPTVPSNGVKSDKAVVDRQIGFTPSTTSAPSVRTDASSTKSKDKEGSNWLNKISGKDNDSKRLSTSANGLPSGRTTSSNSTPTRDSSANRASAKDKVSLAPPITSPAAAATPPRVIATPAANNNNNNTPNNNNNNTMSSSFMSQTSSSGSTAPAPPSSSSYTTQSSLGRKPSASGRDRNVSASSGTSYKDGGGLGRRLSGMSGKFKMGFGKKSGGKDREGGIEEEDQKKSERKGLLG